MLSHRLYRRCVQSAVTWLATDKMHLCYQAPLSSPRCSHVMPVTFSKTYFLARSHGSARSM